MPAHGMLVLAAGLLLAAEPPRKPAGPAPVERKTTRYTVELVVVQADAQGRDFGPDGRGKILAEPRLLVPDGHTAQFLAGGQAPVPAEKDAAPTFVPVGLALNFKITAQPDQRLRVAAWLKQSEIESADAEQLTVASKAVQTAAVVELGDPVKLALKDDRGAITHWARLRVLEKEESAVTQYRARGTEKKPAKVGQIKIIGNTTVAAETILRHVPLYPGRVLEAVDLRVAERNLERTKLFVGRPTVAAIGADADEIKDVLIAVEEKSVGTSK